MDSLDLGESSSFYFRKTQVAPSPPGTREKVEGEGRAASEAPLGFSDAA